MHETLRSKTLKILNNRDYGIPTKLDGSIGQSGISN